MSKDMAVEIRYVGNRADNEWSSINYNTIRGENLVANGFMNEFKLAMGNLAANNASGVASRVGSFAYFGTGTGTARCRFTWRISTAAPTPATRGIHQRRRRRGPTPPSPAGFRAQPEP